MSFYPDINRLRKAGYIVVEQSPWHYQITLNDRTVNIWPSKQKYMEEYGAGASHYSDVIKAVESIVGSAKHKETYAERLAKTKAYLNELYPIPLETEAVKAWAYELSVITNWVHRKVKKRQEWKEAMDF